MSKIQIHKKGGPYTKKEQEKRRAEVYKLYFEEAKPVIKIAQRLDVNRNTINEDVKYWYLQLASEISAQTVLSSALKQVHNMELQKARLREQLDSTTEFSQRLAVEKFLLEIESKLAQYITKIMSSGQDFLKAAEPEVSEEEIKNLVRDLVLKNRSSSENAYVFSENKIRYEIIRKTRCDANHVEAFLKKMLVLDMRLCQQDDTYGDDSDFSETYNLLRFAHMRNYISDDEFAKINKKIAGNSSKRVQIQRENKELALHLPNF